MGDDFCSLDVCVREREIEPRALYMLGMHSTTDYIQNLNSWLYF